MEITAYSFLLYLVLAIFLFCYFIATRVWIQVDERNRKSTQEPTKDDLINQILFLSRNFCKNLLAKKRKKADKMMTITAILAPDNPLVQQTAHLANTDAGKKTIIRKLIKPLKMLKMLNII